MSKKNVHFYNTEDDGSQTVVGSAILENGLPIRFEGVSDDLIDLLKHGISPTGLESDVLTPEDGEAYLEALAKAFSGTYFRASRIIEE